ncbi:MAG: 2-oxo-4-hydroxy-4-carboxy-5-ureidoimidazoline decarboxylase [Gemmatimonadetes bacterium]|nr:2-oxo-4-hydroxy-4-carboxy-5-ureidoimidazoline decarboxylase [Gemmatimonadota bacterium]
MNGPCAGVPSLDELPAEAAAEALLRCCGSKRWVEAMLEARPFGTRERLHSAARSTWWSLDEDDWLEAFAAHPRIGDADVHERWSKSEQAGVDASAPDAARELERRNEAYETRFGFVFLICATGLDLERIGEALDARLDRTREEELRAAAEEQANITALRLDRLLAETG